MDVSIIIVTWNSARFIRECLQSIREHTKTRTYEILVVDNASSDDTVRIIEAEFPEARLIKAGGNLGFPRGNNLALKHAKGRYAFLLNPDTRLESDAVEAMASAMDEDASVGMTGPLIIEKSGEEALYVFREFPSLSTALFRQFGLRRAFADSPLFGREILAGTDRTQKTYVPCLMGAAMMMYTEFLRDTGGLHTEIPMYYEDVEICARVADSGMKLCYVPEARIVHMGGQSTALSPAKRQLYAMQNGQAPWMYLKYYRGPLAASLFSLITGAGSVFRLAIAAVLWPFRREESVRLWAEARAMLWWACYSKDKFPRLFDGWFAPLTEEERGGQ